MKSNLSRIIVDCGGAPLENETYNYQYRQIAFKSGNFNRTQMYSLSLYLLHCTD